MKLENLLYGVEIQKTNVDLNTEIKEIKIDSYQETEPPLRPLPKALVREMDFNDRREQALEKLRNYPA